MPPINEYDELAQRAAEPIRNEYDTLLGGDRLGRTRQVQNSMMISRDASPDRKAKALDISRQTKVPLRIVEENFDDFVKKEQHQNINYQKMASDKPGLTNFLVNPDNAAVSKDDFAALSKIEDGTSFLVHRNKTGITDLPGELSNAAITGWNNLGASTFHLAAAYGLSSIEDTAQLIADANKRAAELRIQMPNYAKDFNKVLDEEGQDVDRAFNQFTSSFSEIKRGHIVDAMKNFTVGGVMSVAETVDMIAAAAVRPRGLIYSTTENLANSLPSLALGLAGAKGGAVGGAAFGGFVGAAVTAPVGGAGAVPGAGIGATAGGIGGFVGGSFLGAVPVEVGAWINQELTEKGFDVTNPEDLIRAYRNPQLMADIRERAERKGLTTAGVDALFNTFAGRFIGGPTKGLAQKAASAIKDVGLQSVGEATSEFAGQVAAEEGDLSKVSFAEAIQEGIISLGQSTADVAIGASVRGKFSKDPIQGSEEFAEETDKAVQAEHEAQGLEEIGQAIDESKLAERSPEKFKEFVDEVMDDDESSIYFQMDDWDSYWRNKGRSPSKAAEEILDDAGKKYLEAKNAGTDLAIPLGSYLSRVGPTDDYQALVEFARTTPDGMTFAEAKEHMDSLNATIKELAAEVIAQDETTVSQREIQINKIVSDQLKEAGQTAQEAKANASLLGSAFQTLGQRTGQDPIDLFNRYDLQITKTDKGTAQAELVLGQDKKGTFKAKGTKFSIELLKDADRSTFLHETGHFYVEVLNDLTDFGFASEQMKEDFDALIKWSGFESTAKWKESSIEDRRLAHENIARGFEAYLLEGKAPNKKLQSAFRRFRVWLTNIYQEIRGLNVQLTNEVRTVFDRILATDEEIAGAERDSGTTDLFDGDPVGFGMPESKVETYREAIGEAKARATEDVTAKMLTQIARERKRWWIRERKVVRDRILGELNATKEYRTLSILQKGKLPDGSPAPQFVEDIKISKQDLVEQYGNEFVKNLPRPVIYTTQENGVQPDVAAQMLGFESGDAMIQSISIPKAETTANVMADREMKVKHGDMLIDRSVEKEAMNAIHNDKKAEILRLELQHLVSEDFAKFKGLTRRIARPVRTIKEVREEAQRIAGELSVRDVKPIVYQRAEGKASKNAVDAMLKGDFDLAFQEKQKELLNHEIYREVVKAKEFIDKNLKDFRKFNKKDEKIAKTRDIDLVNSARSILASFGLSQTDKGPLEFLEKMKRFDPDTYSVMAEMVAGSIEHADNYKNISFNDFTDMTETVQALWELSRSTKQIEIDGKKVDLDGVLNSLGERMDTFKNPNQQRQYTKRATDFERTKMSFLGVRSALRRVESWVQAMDGGDSGVFRDFIWTPVSEGVNEYKDKQVAIMKRFKEMLKQIEPALSKEGTFRSAVLQHDFSREELVTAILHSGNESNLKKLLVGRNWGSLNEDGSLNTFRWEQFLAEAIADGSITKAHYEFAQNVWDLLEEVKVDSQKAHKKMYGFFFSEITATEIVNEFGTFRGGYIPAVADTFLVEDAAIRKEKEEIENLDNSFMFPTTGRGFTKNRVENYNKPLSLDLALVPGHIDKAMRFTFIEPHIKDAGKIIVNQSFREELRQVDPTAGSEMLVPWLQRTAQQKVEAPSRGEAGRFLDRVTRALRRNSGLSIMTLNVVNTVQQFTGFSIALSKVKRRYLRNALWHYVKDAKVMTAEINEKSSFMRNRTAAQIFDIQKDINEILINPNPAQKALAFAKQHGFVLQQMAQNVVDVITWGGRYEQAIADGATEKEAGRLSDSAVRVTQGSFDPQDISRFEAGSPFARAFTMFYSYFNMQANLLTTEFGNTYRELGFKKGAGRMFYIYWFAFATPAVLSELMVIGASGTIDEDDDDQYLDDFMAIFFAGQARTMTALVPGGNVIQASINSFNDKWYDDRITVSPVISQIESSVRAPKSVYDALVEGTNKKRAVRDTLTLIGQLTGLPVLPLAKPAGFLLDLEEGKVRPPTGPIDAARGLITGKGDRR